MATQEMEFHKSWKGGSCILVSLWMCLCVHVLYHVLVGGTILRAVSYRMAEKVVRALCVCNWNVNIWDHRVSRNTAHMGKINTVHSLVYYVTVWEVYFDYITLEAGVKSRLNIRHYLIIQKKSIYPPFRDLALQESSFSGTHTVCYCNKLL